MKRLALLLLVPALALGQTSPDKVRICDRANATRCAEVATDGTIKVTTSAGGGASFSSARATANAPTYGEGTDQPFSQDLAGWLRTRSLHTAATAPLACRLSDGSNFLSSLSVTGTFWQATQPVSAASLPLPTGAATSAIQTDGTQKTQVVDAGGIVLDLDASGRPTVNVNGTVPVSGTFWQATQPVSGTVSATQGTAAAGSGAWPVSLTDTSNTVVKPGDAGNSAIRVNVVAGGAGGGVAQIQVYDGAAWDNVGGAAESASLAHLPVKIQGTGANVIEPLNTTPAGTEYALPVRTVGSASGDPSYTDATGTTVPANAAFVGGTDGTNTRALKTDANGELQVDVLSMPTTTVNGTVTCDVGTGTQAVSGTVTANAGAGPSVANSWHVRLTDGTDSSLISGAGALLVDASATTQPVSGTVTVGTFPDNEPFNLAQVGATTVVTGGVAGTLGVGGHTAHAATDAGNPVSISGYAEAEGAALDTTNMAEGDRSRLKTDIEGRLLVRNDHPFTWSCTRDAQTASGVCQASAAAGYTITDVLLTNGATAQTLKVVYGTGSTCGTGTTVIVPTTYLAVNGGAVISLRTPFRIPSTVDICCLISGSTGHSCRVAGERGP